MRKLFLIFLTTLATLSVSAQTVSTFAGNIYNMAEPTGVALDAAGNIYVADQFHHRIQKITPAGVFSIFAGSSLNERGNVDGSGTDARFGYPRALAIDASGNVFVADYYNNTIRKITPDGNVSTFAGSTAGYADGQGTVARFTYPTGITIDAAGNLYVSDRLKIRKITPQGYVTTLAGSENYGNADGYGTAATFLSPYGITVDPSGNVYVADEENSNIRKITPAGLVSTLAIDTVLGSPTGITLDAAGNLYVADIRFNKIFKITPNGNASTWTGNGTAGSTDGQGKNASFSLPYNLFTDISGNILVADSRSQAIRKIDPAGTVSTVKSNHTNAQGSKASFNFPQSLIIDASDNIYVADVDNNVIRKITPDGLVSTFAGNGTQSNTNGPALSAGIGDPLELTMDMSGNIYVISQYSDSLRKITPAGLVSSLSIHYGTKDADGDTVSRFRPRGFVFDISGNMFVSDGENNRICKITPDGNISIFAGSSVAGNKDGKGKNASFNVPVDLAIDAAGNLYVNDIVNNQIRKITPDAVVTTLAGNGTSGDTDGPGATASFKMILDLALDATGNVYAADYGNNKIRKITPDGNVSTYAGTGVAGFADGSASNASFNGPTGVALDHYGNVYVSDGLIGLIRKIVPNLGDGVEDPTLASTDLSIYPNPASNTLMIKSTSVVNTFQICNITGKELLSGTGISVDVSTLDKGMYFLSVSTDKGISVKKFIRE